MVLKVPSWFVGTSAVTTPESVSCCTYRIDLDDGLERIFRHAIDTGQEITSGT